MYIIADIAGQHDALMRLVDRFDPRQDIYLLGDMVDRGPDSKHVIQWAMDTPGVYAIMGNHEHMMIDHARDQGIYPKGCWEDNGGDSTIHSYMEHWDQNVFLHHLEWIEKLPKYKMFDDLLLTHAPLAQDYASIYEADFDSTNDKIALRNNSLIWNRTFPMKRDRFQVFGHNSHWGLRWFDEWAVCLDQSRKEVVTAMHWPSRQILEETYVKDIQQRSTDHSLS